MKISELTWLAGWLEGEGTFYFVKDRNAAIIQAFSVDRDIITKVCNMLSVKPHYIKPRKHPHGYISQEGWRLHLESEPAIALMRKIRPFMGKRRTEKIDEILNLWETRSNRPQNKMCACGCGEILFAHPRKIYVNGTHAMRAFRKKAA